jgi:hypothetical protein
MADQFHNMPASPETSTGSDDRVRVFFDAHYQVNKSFLFNLTVERLGTKSRIDFLVDLSSLDQSQAEKLVAVLTQSDNRQTTATEEVQIAARLLDLSLEQQGRLPKERNVIIKKLLLLDAPSFSLKNEHNVSELPTLSPKEALLELAGQEFLIKSGHAVLFEESKSLPHYPEVRASWLGTIEALNFGTPKIPAASPAERAQIELFFLELGYGSPASAFTKHTSLLLARSDHQVFWKAVANTLDKRSKVDNPERSLDFYLIYGWLHSFFWAMSNAHRTLLLTRVYGIPITSRSGDPEALLKKRVERLGLKGWSSFPQTYSEAPIIAKVYHQLGQEPEQDSCEIFMRMAGQI